MRHFLGIFTCTTKHQLKQGKPCAVVSSYSLLTEAFQIVDLSKAGVYLKVGFEEARQLVFWGERFEVASSPANMFSSLY